MEFVPNPETPLVEPEAEPRSRPGVVRRTLATLVLAAGLLIVGGASAVWAASPDPSAATTPSATDTPGTSGTPRSGTDGTTHPKGDCPNMDGSSSGTDGSTSSPSSSG